MMKGTETETMIVMTEEETGEATRRAVGDTTAPDPGLLGTTRIKREKRRNREERAREMRIREER